MASRRAAHMYLCGVLLFFGLSSAAIYPVDDHVPFLVSRGRVLVWSDGADALLVAGSRFVRVNQRGVTMKASHWSVRRLGGLGWEERACFPGVGSLCEVSNVSRVFPAERPRFSSRHRPGGLGCTRASSERILDHDWGYDVSACDVLDGGGDVLFYDHTVAFKDTGISPVRYWLLCVLSVFVVRSFSYKLRGRLHCEGGVHQCEWFSSDQWTIGACALSILVSITPDFTTELVTDEDFLCCTFLVLYGAFYMFMWVAARHDPNPPIYNLIAVTLQLTASRLYKGIETPYGGVLLYVIFTRLLMKLRAGWNLIQCITVCLDCMLVTLLSVFGVPFSGTYVIVVGILAFATSDLLT